MMLLNITKNIIKIGMILTSISILGCCKSKSQHILLPIDNVIYFMLDVNNDTTTIIEKKGLYSREVLKYYRDTTMFSHLITAEIKNCSCQ